MDRQTAMTAIEALVMAGKMALTDHAKNRDPTRGKYPLTGEQIRNCLLNGSISEGPTPDIRETDGWKVTVTRYRADEKHEVAAVLIVEKKVLVITGYGWEKLTARIRKRQKDEDENDE